MTVFIDWGRGVVLVFGVFWLIMGLSHIHDYITGDMSGTWRGRAFVFVVNIMGWFVVVRAW